MALILYGNSEIGEYVWSEIGNLIRLRHLFRSPAVANLKSLKKIPIFLHVRAILYQMYQRNAS